jgi:uncharacterized membrane protein
MKVGPIQVIVFGFDRSDQFRGEALEELANLRGRGMIRLIDLFVAVKEPSGRLTVVDMNDLTEEETVEFGRVIGSLLGTSEVPAVAALAAAEQRTLAAAAQSIGLDARSLQQVVEHLEPGKAFAILMFEHTWAIPLRDAIRRTGGVPLAQAFLTQESLMMVGEELRAIAEAEQVIEVANIIRSATILDTLATLQEAEAIKTAVAADVVRTLIVAGLIEEAAANEVIDTLAASGKLETKYLQAAEQEEAQVAAEEKEIFAAAS